MPGPQDFYPRAPGQRPVAHATVSTRQPAPGAFTDPLFIVMDYAPDDAIKIVNWPVIHGATLPALGADVLVQFDEYKNARVTWWDGVYSA
jgi:hypothetical protein